MNLEFKSDTNNSFKLTRSIAVFLIISFSLSLLAGCVKKSGPAKTNTAKPIELVYYKLFDEEDVMNSLITKYQAKHPNVSIKYRKFTDPVEYENLIINELAEGQGPDIFSMPNYWFMRNQKKINPLSPQTLSAKVFEQTFVNVTKDDLIFKDTADNQEKVYGIPLAVDTLALYYNKSAFEDAIPDRGRPAPTWEALKEDVFQLTKKDNSFERFQVAGISMGRSDNIARAVDILYMIMLQYKTKFYDDKFKSADFARQQAITPGGLNINPATEALNLYTSFGLPSNKNYSWNQYLADPKSSTKELDTFVRGKVTMIFGYSYLYNQILAQIKELKDKGVVTIDPKDVKIAAVPQVNDPKTSTQKRDAYANYFAETVSRTSAHPAEAWDFLNFISSKENLKYYSQQTHAPTSRRDLIDDQMKDPVYGVFAEQTGYAGSFPIYDAVRYRQIFSAAIDSVLATVQPNAAINTAANQVNAIMDLK